MPDSRQKVIAVILPQHLNLGALCSNREAVQEQTKLHDYVMSSFSGQTGQAHGMRCQRQ